MRILVVGNKGFIGKKIYYYFKNNTKHDVYGINRDDFDFLDTIKADIFFEKEKIYDIIIYTCSIGGNRNKNDDETIVYKNIKMFENIVKHKDKYKRFFLLSSGASLSRNENIRHQMYVNNIPCDFYGFSKFIIEKLANNYNNVYIFRIFNCFDYDEIQEKCIKTFITNYLNKKEFLINENKYYDFMHYKDIELSISFFIDNEITDKIINLVYKDKYKLNEIAEIINSIDKHKVYINIKKETNNNYIGLYNLDKYTNKGLKISNFKDRIKEYYHNICNENCKFILGTAQLGIKYGKTNKTGQPSKEDALEILQYAINNNITSFDTARLYGASEELLGQINKNNPNINIITKLDCMKNIEKLNETEIINEVKNSISLSMKNLNKSILDTLLLHDFNHYLNYKIIWNTILELKKINIIKNIGVSIYFPEEFEKALEDDNIDIIQLPFNLLDTRWLQDSIQEKIKKRKNVTIFCRSIFLQGIIINEPSYWPVLPNINNIIYYNKILKMVTNLKFNNPFELCISYVKSQSWINGIIFGIDNKIQLNEIIKTKDIRLLNKDELKTIKNEFQNVPLELLNPSVWPGHI